MGALKSVRLHLCSLKPARHQFGKSARTVQTYSDVSPESSPNLQQFTAQGLPEPEVVSVHLKPPLDFFAPQPNRALCKDPLFSINFKYATGDAWLFPGSAVCRIGLVSPWKSPRELRRPARAKDRHFDSPGMRLAGRSKMTCWERVIPPRAGASYQGIQHRARDARLKPEQKT